MAANVDIKQGQNRFGKWNYFGSCAGNNGSRNTGKVCTHCARTGHTIETSYKKHGFPPNWQKNVSNVTGSRSEMEDSKSDDDGKTVGITKEQYEKLVNMLQATVVSQGSNSADKSVNMVTHGSFPSFENNSGSISLICALNSSNLGLWIIDSGASVHIYSSFRHFKSYVPIKSVSIRLPNGHKSYDRFKGTIQFSAKLYIIDILYVPEFTLNMISVPKLMIDLKVGVLFDIPKCEIQDVRTKEVIGSGMTLEGLVYLEIPKESENVDVSAAVAETKTLPNTALWHFILGHLSIQRMELMHNDFPSIHVDEGSVCDICHYARQRKLSYNLSLSRATKCYDMIHFDIWGPISTPSIHGHGYLLTALDDFSRYTWIVLLESKSDVANLSHKYYYKS